MKISAETLKNIDYKQFALDHGEKFVVGFVAIFALFVLWKTAWFPIDSTPEELNDIVESTQQKIESSEFPPEQRQKFGTADDLQRRASALFSPIEVSRYQFDNTNLFWPLYPRQEPIKEPEWLTVENLIADSAQVLVPMRRRPDPQQEVAQAEPAAEESEPENEFDRMFRQRGDSGGSRRDRRRDPRADNFDLEEVRRNAARLRQQLEEKKEGSEGPTNTVGKGLPFVSLRGIFPLRRQVQLVAKATSAPNPKDVEALVQFQDFEIQRQTAVRGPDPWSGPWMDVQVEVARHLITKEIAGRDPEIVDVGVQSQIFTMPLPARAMGVWGAEVSHPDIENYTLSSEEVERQVAINKELVDRFRAEIEKEEEKIQRLGRGGFAPQQFDMQDIYQRVLNQKDQWQFSPGLLPQLAEKSPDEQSQILKAEIQKRVKASGQLLLFRYLDFAVEPGQVYRYRVRLKVFNPFFGRDPKYLADASVGDGEVRLTQWSEPSTPVQVQTDSEYYLVDVSAGSGVSTLPKASLDVYQWHPDFGTLVNHEMDLWAGEAISAEVTTDVLRPVEEKFEAEQIKIDTKSMLVDALAAPTIDPNLHSELDIKPAQARTGLGITEQALIMDRFGRLKVIDSQTQSRAHRDAQAMLRSQTAAYENLRPNEETDEDELDRGARRRRGSDDRNDRNRRRAQNPNTR